MASSGPALRMIEKGLFPSRRYLALSLPRWATDCLKRADRALAAYPGPIAFWEKQKSAMRLVALDAKAAQQGLLVGQSLSDARALVSNLHVREIDHGFIASRFADFADWHSYASPMVAVHSDISPYGDLLIDITGVAHLFGGEENMLVSVIAKLSALEISVSGAVASTIGAAWALARFSPGLVVSDEREALAELPVAALRLTPTQIDGLNLMGLKRIGQLYGRERKGLQARFGATLITRLDQALGQSEEKLTPRLPLVEHLVERRFAEPIGLMDDVLACTRDLAIRLSVMLEAQGLGVQSFHLFLYRVDHQVRVLSVNAARGTRDADHITRLFTHRAERLSGEYDAGFGIDMIRLGASSVSPLNQVQLGAFEGRDPHADLDQLFDRLSSRLGSLSILRSRFINSHIPERAVILEPAIGTQAPDPAATPDPNRARPLRLLPNPEPISVIATVPDGPPARMVWRRINYVFIKASGPERIGVEWRRPGEGALTRDYFTAEDEGGRRFWVFREGLFEEIAAPRWFMHGFFP